MYEEYEGKVKDILAIIGILAIGGLLLFAGWKLFFDRGTGSGGNISDHERTAEQLRDSLGTIGSEQQRALESIGRIDTGIGNSERIVRELGEGVRISQNRIDSITRENRRINERIREAKERLETSQELLRDSQQRIGECQQILQAVRETKRSGS